MKVSTKGRYALRFMLELALNQDKGPVSLKHVSMHQGISQKYLWQVITPLKAAGLIQAVRGLRGGYKLVREPSAISVAGILNVVEGDTSLVNCLGNPKGCKRVDACPTREVWKELNDKLVQAMESVSLADILRKHSGFGRCATEYDI
jgi:Rrf2 family protein